VWGRARVTIACVLQMQRRAKIARLVAIRITRIQVNCLSCHACKLLIVDVKQTVACKLHSKCSLVIRIACILGIAQNVQNCTLKYSLKS